MELARPKIGRVAEIVHQYLTKAVNGN